MKIDVADSGHGKFKVNGGEDLESYDQNITAGTVLSLSSSPDSGYQIKKWSDGNTNSSRNVTVNSDLTLTIEFEEYDDPGHIGD